METTPVNLSNLIVVVKNEVVKKTEYNAKIRDIEDKITGITNLASNTTLNAKKNKVKNEIAGVTVLATTTAPDAKIN